MKSFADWTDEIRALMNPPKPMINTCDMAALEDYEEGFFTPTLTFDTAQGVDYSQEFYFTRTGNKVTVGNRVKKPEVEPKIEREALLHSFLNYYGPGDLLPWQQEMLARIAGGQWSPREVMLRSGRQCGKSSLTHELLKNTIKPLAFNKIEFKE